MPGTWFGLEIAKRGTMTHRAAMEVTGHNIANASTPGYSRQEAVIKPTDPWTVPGIETKMLPGQLGTGSQVAEVRRIRDFYLDVQYRQSASYEGYWGKKLDMASRVETVFPEPEGRGLQDVLVDFFNDWQKVNNNPADPGVKMAVKETGDELAATFRQMNNQLSTIRGGITESLDYEVDKINQILTRLEDLSNTITYIKGNGAQPNDLLDERDNLLDELAQYGRIDVEAREDGFLNVKFIDGNATVIQTDPATGKVTANQVSLSKDASSNNILTIGTGATAATINLTGMANATNATGTLLGLESSWQEINATLTQLDNLAENIAKEVNAKLGITFFTGTKASDIELDSAVKNDPVSVIDGSKAIEVARLSSTTIASLGNTTFERYYQGIVTQVGANIDKHSNMLDNQNAISQQIDALRQSVSGVAVDEELTKVIQFQYGYQACARMISMQDEMLDYIINRIW